MVLIWKAIGNKGADIWRTSTDGQRPARALQLIRSDLHTCWCPSGQRRLGVIKADVSIDRVVNFGDFFDNFNVVDLPSVEFSFQ